MTDFVHEPGCDAELSCWCQLDPSAPGGAREPAPTRPTVPSEQCICEWEPDGSCPVHLVAASAQEPADPPRPRAAIRTPMTADELAEIRDYRDKLAQNGILNASAYRLTTLLNEIDRLREQS